MRNPPSSVRFLRTMNLAISFLALLLSLPATTQESPATETAQEATRRVIEAAPPAARAAWERLLAASRSGSEPIRAFELRAEVLTRDGVRTNEARIAYRYLAPHFIRFNLSQNRETGRGPGVGQSAYWLRDREEVVVLEGRERTEDRRMVDQMAAVSRNFISLSDPARLRLESIGTLPAAPQAVPPSLEREAKKLEWLSIASADFALLDPASRDRRPSANRATVYEVLLGLGETGLPQLAIVRRVRGEGEPLPATPPMLIRLAGYRELDGFRVPHDLFVYGPDPSPSRLVGARFEDKPAQEIYVTEADLRPELSEDDFRP